MYRRITLTVTVAVLLILTGCAPAGPDSSSPPDSPSAAAPAPSSTPARSSAPASPEPESVSGETIVRFTSGDTVVNVTIAPDSPTARDFLSMLPLSLSVREFAGREKISDLPRDLETAGSPGSDPENGDLIYFIPWGNIGFYYNTDGIGYSDQTIHLGTYSATPEQLALLEGSAVTVELVP